MSITREFNLFLFAGRSIPLVVNANQYDQGETWLFNLLDEHGQIYTPTTGAIVGLKSDGHVISNAGTVNSSGQVVITETEQMTAAPGKNLFELLIDDDTHGTANFVLMVEPRPGDNATPSDSDLSLFQQAIDAAAEITEASGAIDQLEADVAVQTARIDNIIAFKDSVTPEMFGAKGDGINDDTEAVIEAFKHKNVVGIGVYAISSAIYAQIDNDTNIAINLKAIETMGYMLWLDAKSSTWDNLIEGNFSIKLDCNLLANDGLRIDRFHGANVDVTVKNFSGTAVCVRYTPNLVCGANHINVFATNLETAETVSDNSIGVLCGQDDIYDIYCANVKTCVRIRYGGNQFTNLHGWTSTQAWFLKSVLIDIASDSNNSIDFLSCDTVQVLFKLDNASTTKYPKLNISSFEIYRNTGVTSSLIYVWWLSGENVFYPAIYGLDIGANYKTEIAWVDGTIPKILIGTDAEETTTLSESLAFAVSVIRFIGINVSNLGLNSLLNCKDCIYTFSGNTYKLNADKSSTFSQQYLEGYRGSARRIKPSNNAFVYPWTENTITERAFTSTVNFVTGTTTYPIIRISEIRELVGSNVAIGTGTFMNVTTQPTIYAQGDALYVKVTEQWIADNSGVKRFVGSIKTDGEIL